MENKYDLEDVLLEAQVMEFLGVTKSVLGSLRYNEKMPFLKVNTRTRLYLKSDIASWLISRKQVLNKADNDTE